MTLWSVPQSTTTENLFRGFRSQLVLAFGRKFKRNKLLYRFITSDPFARTLPGMFGIPERQLFR
jgi:hypothetical protein